MDGRTQGLQEGVIRRGWAGEREGGEWGGDGWDCPSARVESPEVRLDPSPGNEGPHRITEGGIRGCRRVVVAPQSIQWTSSCVPIVNNNISSSPDSEFRTPNEIPHSLSKCSNITSSLSSRNVMVNLVNMSTTYTIGSARRLWVLWKEQ